MDGRVPGSDPEGSGAFAAADLGGFHARIDFPGRFAVGICLFLLFSQGGFSNRAAKHSGGTKFAR
jgi:hypothetical protein